MRRQIKFLRTRLGRVIRDIRRQTADDEALQEIFAVALGRAAQIRGQKQRQRGRKLYSWHAPEVECIGKGKVRTPYEFGVKVSLTITNKRCKGGQFILHAKALPGNPYDGHTLREVIEEAATAGWFLLRWLTLAFLVESLMVAYIPGASPGGRR